MSRTTVAPLVAERLGLGYQRGVGVSQSCR